MKTVILITTFSLLITSCNNSNVFGQKNRVSLVPQSFENPQETRGLPSDAPAEDYDLLNLPPVDTSEPGLNAESPDDDWLQPQSSTRNTNPASRPKQALPPAPTAPTAPNVKPPAPAPAAASAAGSGASTAPSAPAAPAPAARQKPDEVPKAKESLYQRASNFVKNAIWVMVKEGKKIGTPCNFYLRRVLEVSGFAKMGFIANEFDDYAEKNFSSFMQKTFKSTKEENARLRAYLWSFPSSTPFIMNWHRDGVRYGHVAIVERYDNELVIYQASIGSHTARQDKTTVENLLDDAGLRRNLTVYSNFLKK